MSVTDVAKVMLNAAYDAFDRAMEDEGIHPESRKRIRNAVLYGDPRGAGIRDRVEITVTQAESPEGCQGDCGLVEGHLDLIDTTGLGPFREKNWAGKGFTIPGDEEPYDDETWR